MLRLLVARRDILEAGGTQVVEDDRFIKCEQLSLACCQLGFDRHPVLIQLIRDPVECILRHTPHATGHQLIKRRTANPADRAQLTARRYQSAHHLGLGQPALPLRESAALQDTVAAQVLPEHVRDVFRAEFANQLTAAACGIDLLRRPVSVPLSLLALLLAADAFGERRRQLVQVRSPKRNPFLVIEEIFDAFGQPWPLGLRQIKSAEAQDQPLAGAFSGAYRLQQAVAGVGAAVAGDLELADEHVYQRSDFLTSAGIG